MNRSPWRYRILLLVLSPWLVGTVLLQAGKAKNKRFAWQRLGMGYKAFDSSPVWIHCASVGEVNAARPLIEKFSREFPDIPVLVSTTTPTGADTVAQRDWDNVTHQFLPVDFLISVRNFTGAIQPRALLLMETEIWPNLINTVRDQHIPVVIVNGRLSGRSLLSPEWLKPVYKQVLSRVTAVLSRSVNDASGFVTLGVPEDRVETVGNLKFAAVSNIQEVSCDIDRPFWLAASTHQDEELQLVRLLGNYAECANKLLVIAPRHPERSTSIQTELAECNVEFSVRSKGEIVNSKTQVYLADRLGEMDTWYAHAEVVFMGGSLVPVGGHNLLEPAAAGRAIVSGQYANNFYDEAELLLSVGAMKQASTGEGVLEVVNELLAESDTREKMGKAGQQAVMKNAGVLDKYFDKLLPLISIQ